MEPKTSKKKCFVITPIGSEADQIRRHINGIIDAVIIPTLTPKYDISVAHRMTDPGTINKQVIKGIYESDLVIANLTEKNPNVMYELALRHCIGTPVIIIAEEGTSLPFDISGERTIFYINDSQGVIELKKKLEECECAIDFDAKKKVGPVYDALREIDANISIIENIETDHQEDADALKYIVKKLDVLDTKISLYRSNLNIDRDDAEISYNNIRYQTRDIKFNFNVLGSRYSRKQLAMAAKEIKEIIIKKYNLDFDSIVVAFTNDRITVYSKEYWPPDIEADMAVIARDVLEGNGIEIGI